MPPRRLLYLVTEDWYFVSHRLPMARAAREAGFEVHVATRVQRHASAIEAEGFHLHALAWKRGSADPTAALQSVARVRTLYRSVQPDITHHVGVQPSIIGSLASIGLPLVTLNAVAGMGFAFTSTTPRARAVRAVLSGLIPHLFGRRGAGVLVQNPDDHAAMVALGVRPSAIRRIPGSGVDVERLVPLPEPEGAPTVGYVGRLLEDKGLVALIAAHEMLHARGVPVRLLLAGEPDPANPASVKPEMIARWRRIPGVELLGHVKDIREVWAAAHLAVLPSRREGLPLSLLEAAACGRALVATDVPGCREIARAGVNADLVPVDDAGAIASAIGALLEDHERRRRFAAASRAIVENELSSTRIGEAIVALYRDLLDERAAHTTRAVET